LPQLVLGCEQLGKIHKKFLSNDFVYQAVRQEEKRLRVKELKTEKEAG